MRCIQIVEAASGAKLGERVAVAERWWQRLRGLLGRPALQPGEGLLLTPCRAIHMAGMKYPLDVLFLDEQGTVVALYPGIAPGGRTRWHASARSALELPAGTLEATGTQVGDRLRCSPADTREPSISTHPVSPTLSAS
jgi:uncharacterized membrane protein (UPF0127 family)